MERKISIGTKEATELLHSRVCDMAGWEQALEYVNFIKDISTWNEEAQWDILNKFVAADLEIVKGLEM